MSNIIGINGAGGAQPLRPQATANTGPSQVQPAASENVDQVEISDNARLLHKIAQLPDIRTEKVLQVKQAIAQGTYESEEKLNIALDELLNEYWQE